MPPERAARFHRQRPVRIEANGPQSSNFRRPRPLAGVPTASRKIAASFKIQSSVPVTLLVPEQSLQPRASISCTINAPVLSMPVPHCPACYPRSGTDRCDQTACDGQTKTTKRTQSHFRTPREEMHRERARAILRNYQSNPVPKTDSAARGERRIAAGKFTRQPAAPAFFDN